jgi:hypothetical protein
MSLDRTASPSNNEMQLTGGEGGAHAVLERRARVVIERRPQLISVLGRLDRDARAWRLETRRTRDLATLDGDQRAGSG